MLNIQIRIEYTGGIFDARVSLDARTSKLKNLDITKKMPGKTIEEIESKIETFRDLQKKYPDKLQGRWVIL